MSHFKETGSCIEGWDFWVNTKALRTLSSAPKKWTALYCFDKKKTRKVKVVIQSNIVLKSAIGNLNPNEITRGIYNFPEYDRYYSISSLSHFFFFVELITFSSILDKRFFFLPSGSVIYSRCFWLKWLKSIPNNIYFNQRILPCVTLIKKKGEKKNLPFSPTVILICNSCHVHVNKIKSILPADKWTPPLTPPLAFKWFEHDLSLINYTPLLPVPSCCSPG